MTTGRTHLLTMLATTSLVLAVLFAKSFLSSGGLPAASMSERTESAAEERRPAGTVHQPTVLMPEALQDEDRAVTSPRQVGAVLGYREYVGDLPLTTVPPTSPADFPASPPMNLWQLP